MRKKEEGKSGAGPAKKRKAGNPGGGAANILIFSDSEGVLLETRRSDRKKQGKE